MPCYSPLSAWQCQDRSIVWREKPGARAITLSCGQCVGCRLERSRQWAVRCMHEASLYERNCFITLTYSDEFLPDNRSLNYRDFQKFMYRFRERFSGHQPLADGRHAIRFYMCGEYGEKLGRPHFHACIFNFDFTDKVLWSVTPAKSRLYRSADLEALWPFGFSSIGDVNFQSAAYVARYIMKKVSGKGAEKHYFDKVTGEVLTPEFTKMSLKPGIGSGWFDRFHSDVYPHDFVLVNGRKCFPPKYYDKKFLALTAIGEDDNGHPISFEYDALKFARQENAKKFVDDTTTDRLKVRETVTLAKLSRLKRNLT